MSYKALNWAWDLELPASDKIVLVSLADQANDDGKCYPSQSTLAKRTGLARQTISTVLKRLRSTGLLCWERRDRENGSETSCLYTLRVGAPPVIQQDTPCQAERHPPVSEDDTPCHPARHPEPPSNHQDEPSDERTNERPAEDMLRDMPTGDSCREPDFSLWKAMHQSLFIKADTDSRDDWHAFYNMVCEHRRRFKTKGPQFMTDLYNYAKEESERGKVFLSRMVELWEINKDEDD